MESEQRMYSLKDRMSSQGFAPYKGKREKVTSEFIQEWGMELQQSRENSGEDANLRAKKILYIDMDGVLVDFNSALSKQTKEIREKYNGKEDEIPTLFYQMAPMKDAVESFKKLSETYDTFILSTAPWNNPTAWSDKLEWVKKYLGKSAYKRLILSHNKHLNQGDYLIDDRPKNGAEKFKGELIRFGSSEFPDWKAVCNFLLKETIVSEK